MNKEFIYLFIYLFIYMGCVQAWSAYEDLYWRNFAPVSGKLEWTGR
jgi:hypothetical protein